MTDGAKLQLPAWKYWLNVRADSLARALRKMNAKGSNEVLELTVEDFTNADKVQPAGKAVGFYLPYDAALELQSVLDKSAADQEPDAYFAGEFGNVPTMPAPVLYRELLEHGQASAHGHVVMVTKNGAMMGFVLSLEAASQLELQKYLVYSNA